MNLFKSLSNRCRKRHEFGLTLVELVVTCALMALTAVMFMPVTASADNQGYSTTFFSSSVTGPNGITNLPAVVTTGAISNNLNSFLPLKQGRGASLQAQFNASSGTSNYVVLISPSTDGTNIDSAVWTWIVNAAGTTTQTRTTNWSRGSLDGYSALVIVGLTNQNAGTLTNKGFIFNVPNS